MFKSLFKKDEKAASTQNATRNRIASALGLDPETEYPLLRSLMNDLNDFYSVFLKYSYKGLLQSFDTLDDKEEGATLKHKYEFVVMSIPIGVSRTRADLFSRDYASVFIPNKSLQELRGSDFTERMNQAFPMRLIRVYELLAGDISTLSVASLKKILLDDIPFICPEYFELLLKLYDLADSLSIEEVYDLLLPFPGVKEGIRPGVKDFMYEKSLAITGLSQEQFLEEWKVLKGQAKRKLHPHLENFVQWGTFVDEFI